MLPMGSILFPLIVAPYREHILFFKSSPLLRSGFLDVRTVQSLVYQYTKDMCTCFKILIVILNPKLYFGVLYFDDFCVYRQYFEIKISAKYSCFTVLFCSI